MNIGELIPDITLKNQNGKEVNLKSLSENQALVVYFYPKDDTPGCTAEACGFRDRYEEFEEAGAKVVGISTDSVKSHKQFAERHRLNFALLADTDRKAEKAFGVPRNLFGLLPGRVTYIFNREGQLINSFSSAIMATKHISEALKALRSSDH